MVIALECATLNRTSSNLSMCGFGYVINGGEWDLKGEREATHSLRASSRGGLAVTYIEPSKKVFASEEGFITVPHRNGSERMDRGQATGELPPLSTRDVTNSD
jgi:hypothetical protein